MTLLGFEPIKDFDLSSNRFQKIFDEFAGFDFANQNTFSPKISISENKKNILIYAEIPGVQKENIKLTLQDNVLTIEGEKKKVNEDKDINIYKEERNYGKFKRSFTLPVEVDSDNVNATFNNGILEIELHKVETKEVKERIVELN